MSGGRRGSRWNVRGGHVRAIEGWRKREITTERGVQHSETETQQHFSDQMKRMSHMKINETEQWEERAKTFWLHISKKRDKDKEKIDPVTIK